MWTVIILKLFKTFIVMNKLAFKKQSEIVKKNITSDFLFKHKLIGCGCIHLLIKLIWCQDHFCLALEWSTSSWPGCNANEAVTLILSSSSPLRQRSNVCISCLKVVIDFDWFICMESLWKLPCKHKVIPIILIKFCICLVWTTCFPHELTSMINRILRLSLAFNRWVSSTLYCIYMEMRLYRCD